MRKEVETVEELLQTLETNNVQLINIKRIEVTTEVRLSVRAEDDNYYHPTIIVEFKD